MVARASPQVLALLAALVEERTGIHYELRDYALFADKALGRAREVGFDSALDYYYFLRYDSGGAAEIDALVDAIVVTETYFFREAEALRAALEHTVMPAARAGSRPRVCSAACASGDEPLTAAMMLDEAGVLEGVDIVGSDLSLGALQRAKAHGWSARSLRAMPARAERWITMERERARVDRRLLDAVDWRRVNLVDQGAAVALGTFDLIVCRNVLIYFADDTIRAVVRALAERLRPEGRLLVGASESLLRFGTMLECEERGGAFLYRRSGA